MLEEWSNAYFVSAIQLYVPEPWNKFTLKLVHVMKVHTSPAALRVRLLDCLCLLNARQFYCQWRQLQG